MALQYDINKIFAELEQQVQEKKKQHNKIDETKENNPSQSPEDAPQTQKVAPATSKTTEDTNGGDEASKKIKDSPNSVDNGENPDKKNKSKNTKNTGEQGQGDGQGDEEKKKTESSNNTGNKGDGAGSGDKQNNEQTNSKNKDTSSKNLSNEKDKNNKSLNTGEQGQGDGQGDEEKKKTESSMDTGSKGKGVGSGDKQNPEQTDSGKNQKNNENEEDDYFITTNGKNPSKSKPKTTPEDLQKAVENLFEEKQKKQEEFKTQHRQEYLKKYILEIIKKIAAQHAGIDKQDGSETFDKKTILQHMLKHQNYKLLGDKYDLKDARYVQFFIDTSGVYGCGSNKIMHELMPEVISILERQGYECYIAACGNGFYQRDMVEDEYYGTRKTLEGYKTGKVSKIACPTPQTAAKMANEAEFSVILADFDGLSSICEMANLCQKDKVPYFLCTEDRYPWEDPTLHDWVDPNLCDYNPELVYDVSMDGNPTLEQYEDLQYYYNSCYDDEYEQDDSQEYDDYGQDDSQDYDDYEQDDSQNYDNY